MEPEHFQRRMENSFRVLRIFLNFFVHDRSNWNFVKSKWYKEYTLRHQKILVPLFHGYLNSKVQILWEGHKIWKNLPLFLMLLSKFQKRWEIFSHFVAFSQYLNFTITCFSKNHSALSKTKFTSFEKYKKKVWMGI